MHACLHYPAQLNSFEHEDLQPARNNRQELVQQIIGSGLVPLLCELPRAHAAGRGLFFMLAPESAMAVRVSAQRFSLYIDAPERF